MAWEIVVGLETHAQLLTAAKMFSAASCSRLGEAALCTTSAAGT